MASSRGLSDYNQPGYRAKVASPAFAYSDLNLKMPIHPNKKDLIPLTDIDAVKQSIKNLILTSYGEKLFKPKFGGNVASKLFENVNRFTALSIKNSIVTIIEKFERRATDINVQVIDNSDGNGYDVTIGFKIVNIPQIVELEFQLTRTR